jgi:hypothetical protein
MRISRMLLVLLACTGTSTFMGISQAQSPAGGSAPAPKTAARAARPAQQVAANLAQLMRGTLYPASNVVFAAQGDDPAKVPQAPDPSVAVNLLASSYGKWEAVENSSLAMFEVANLLTIPGRKCANGIAVPINNPDWPKFVQGLRDAAMVAYKAAHSKNQDNILMAADVLTTACANCHNKYREKTNLADRCK